MDLSLGLSSDLARILPNFGGNRSESEDRGSDAINHPQTEADGFLSLVHLHSQLLAQHYATIYEKPSYVFAEELNTLQKLPFQQYATIAAGSTFIVSSLRPLYDRGPSRRYGSNLSKVLVCKRLRRVDGSENSAIMTNRLHAAVNEILALTYPTLREHENIVELMGLWWENNPSGSYPLPILVMEQAEFGTLADLQQSPLTLRYTTKLRLCLDVACGLEAIHDASIVHSDLKSENVLVFEHPYRGYIAKLSDFGSTTEGGVVGNLGGSVQQILTLHETLDPIQLPVVTFPWNAPEYISRVRNIELRLMDIYSLGLLVWRVMLDGENPFILLGFSRDPSESRRPIEDLKQSGEIVERARESLLLQFGCEAIAQDLDLNVIFDIFDCTLQLSPQERSLDKTIRCMGGEPSLHNLWRLGDELTNFSTYDPNRPPLPKITQKWDGYSLSLTPREDTSVARYATKQRIVVIQEDADVLKWLSLLNDVLGGVFPEGHIDTESILEKFANFLEELSPPEDIPIRFEYFLNRLRDQAEILHIQIPGALALRQDNTVDSVNSKRLKKIAMRNCIPLLGTSLRDSISSFRDESILSSRDQYCGIGINLLKQLPFDLRDSTRMEAWIRSELPNHHKRFDPQMSKSVNSLWAISEPRNNLLHLAAMAGYTEVILLLLDKFEFDIDYPNFFADTPLHFAMMSGHHEAARLLIQRSANVTKKNGNLDTPLHWISKLDEDQIDQTLNLLLNAGADINAVAGVDPDLNIENEDEDELSMPDSAISSGTSSEYLTSWDEIFFRTSVHGSPLHVAVAANCPAAVKALCVRGADTTLKAGQKGLVLQIDPFQLAVLLHLTDLVDIMSPYYPRIASDSVEAGMLLGIAMSHNASTVRMLIHGSNFMHSTESMIKWCIQQLPNEQWTAELNLGSLVVDCDRRSLEILFDHGLFNTGLESRAPFRGYQLTPLQIAIAQGKHDLFSFLLERGADINATLDERSTSNCLHLSAFTGLQSKNIIDLMLAKMDRSLLEARGDCFTCFQTPFMLAVQQGNFTLASILLAHGANIDAVAPTQFTSGLLAPMTILGQLARQGFETSLAQLKFLLSGEDSRNKASFVVAPSARFTALHAAALCPPDRQDFSGTSLVLEYLLSVYRADEEINQTDVFGCTALHIATIFQFQEAVQILLAYGADPRVRDSGGLGLTALEYAEANHAMAQKYPIEEYWQKNLAAVSRKIDRTSAIVDLLRTYDKQVPTFDVATTTTPNFEQVICERAWSFIQTVLQSGVSQFEARENPKDVTQGLNAVVDDFLSKDTPIRNAADTDTAEGPIDNISHSSPNPCTYIPSWLLYAGGHWDVPSIDLRIFERDGGISLRQFEVSFEIYAGRHLPPSRQWMVCCNGMFVPDDHERPITQRFIEVTKQNFTTISQLAAMAGQSDEDD